jgi:hypothetical protein
VKPISEDWARTVDCVGKALTAIAIILGGGWTVYQYLDGRSYQLTTARIEAQKPFLDKRLQLYIAVTSAAATIATSKNENDVAKAKEQFWNLYWGPLILVDDRTIEHSMQQFGDCVQDNKKCDAALVELSRGLALSCNRSLTHDWAPNPPQNITVHEQ